MELKTGLSYLEFFIGIYCSLQLNTHSDDRRFSNFVIDDSYRSNDEKTAHQVGSVINSLERSLTSFIG